MNYGEIVHLGRHRLMCGDATKAEDVHALVAGEKVDLVLTDPPYGMKCQDKHGVVGENKPRRISPEMWRPSNNGYMRARAYPIMVGDDSQDTARLHYPIARALTDKLIFWGGQYFANFLPISGAWLFWDKHTGKNDFSDGELAWCSFGKRIRYYSHLWNGVLRAGKQAYNLKRRVHPTQKPVELHAHILEDFTHEGDVILDCFGGSGTTLIAAEITARKCLMMELSPDYCDIIINRYNTLMKGQINYEDYLDEAAEV